MLTLTRGVGDSVMVVKDEARRPWICCVMGLWAVMAVRGWGTWRIRCRMVGGRGAGRMLVGGEGGREGFSYLFDLYLEGVGLNPGSRMMLRFLSSCAWGGGC